MADQQNSVQNDSVMKYVFIDVTDGEVYCNSEKKTPAQTAYNILLLTIREIRHMPKSRKEFYTALISLHKAGDFQAIGDSGMYEEEERDKLPPSIASDVPAGKIDLVPEILELVFEMDEPTEKTLVKGKAFRDVLDNYLFALCSKQKPRSERDDMFFYLDNYFSMYHFDHDIELTKFYAAYTKSAFDLIYQLAPHQQERQNELIKEIRDDEFNIHLKGYAEIPAYKEYAEAVIKAKDAFLKALKAKEEN